MGSNWRILSRGVTHSALHFFNQITLSASLRTDCLQKHKSRSRQERRPVQSTIWEITVCPLRLSWERICRQCGRPGFNLWVGKIPWWRETLPIPVFWPGEFHGLYSPWGHKESDTTERLRLFFQSGWNKGTVKNCQVLAKFWRYSRKDLLMDLCVLWHKQESKTLNFLTWATKEWNAIN